jgi:hypothetical protein
MARHWDKVFIQTIVWLVVEIFLNFVGLDNLADYSEFINNFRRDRLSVCDRKYRPSYCAPSPCLSLSPLSSLSFFPLTVSSPKTLKLDI